MKENLKKMIQEAEHTNDLLYSYRRKTEINTEVFKFTFEFDLDREITEPDLADIILYCCQRDMIMQEIILKYGKERHAEPVEGMLSCEEKQFDFEIHDILSIANEYRLAVQKRAEEQKQKKNE